ncbi:unnamed protein product [Lactuca virosa]|uniref:Protein kinase domain-containing protein n=1 Tax=Lactuca virosa TaxID=75947 RepID=A0AAU9NX05_9ASTR|nr:unnamed protein product [Lactuca virosa]
MYYPLEGINHLEIPVEDIQSATNDMADEYVISSNKEFTTYKAQLFWSGQLIDIAAQSYDRLDADGVSMFENTALILSGLKHKNIVSFLGYSGDPYWIFIVSEYESKRSLDEHLREASTLSWMERLQICAGIAHGLSYLHYEEGRDYSVIHCNIKSSSILLDDNWEPKIFRLWKEAWSDDEDGESLVESARSHYEEETLEDLIDTDVWEEMDEKSIKIFSETAYSCLKEQRAHQPSMDQIVRQLDKALQLQMKFENLEDSGGESTEVTSFDRLKGKDFEHLKIGLSDIEFATENFAERYCIGSGGYGKVYKAVLHLDQGTNSSTIEENNKDELMRKTVAIKRIFSRGDKQGEDGVAYDKIYMAEDEKGLGPIARRHYDKGTLKELIDPVLKQESDEIFFTQNEGLSEESLATFFEIVYGCLAESQAKRPKMEVVIKELEQALFLQENFKNNLKFSLEHIKLATQSFKRRSTNSSPSVDATQESIGIPSRL